MPVSDAERDELANALDALVTSLEAALAGSAGAARPVELDQPAVGRVSRIDALQQQKMLEANRAAQQRRLQQARAALRRMDDDSYGECATCGDDIGLARLRARPESPHCLECQSRREQGDSR